MFHLLSRRVLHLGAELENMALVDNLLANDLGGHLGVTGRVDDRVVELVSHLGVPLCWVTWC